MWHLEKHDGRAPWPGAQCRLGCRPVHQKQAGAIPGQGTHLGCGFSPWSGSVQEATDRGFSHSLSLSTSLSLSLKTNRQAQP